MNDELLLTSLVRLETSSSKSLILVSFLEICAKRRKQNKVSNNCQLVSLYQTTFQLPSSNATLIFNLRCSYLSFQADEQLFTVILEIEENIISGSSSQKVRHARLCFLLLTTDMKPTGSKC